MPDLTPRSITVPDADGNPVTIAGFDDGSGGFLQGIVYRGADGTPAQVLEDGSLAISVAGGAPVTITKDPAVFEDPFWIWDLADAELGDHFDLTAIPTQGGDVGAFLVLPDPADPRLITADYHKGVDPVGIFANVKPTLDGNWPISWFGDTFDGSTDAQLIFRSVGEGTYEARVVTDVDETLDVLLVDALIDQASAATETAYTDAIADATEHPGTGLLNGFSGATGQIDLLEGILDRMRTVHAVAPPGFDPEPYIGVATDWSLEDWTGGKGEVTAKGALAVLDRADPTDPFLFSVEDDGSLTALGHPGVFNDPTRGPGNFYRLVMSLAYLKGTLIATAATLRAGPDHVEADAHGLSDGDVVVLVSPDAAYNGTFGVINATTDDFQLTNLGRGPVPVDMVTDSLADVYQAIPNTDDGTIWMWLANDLTQQQRGTSTENVHVPGGRWLEYAAGTPI